MKSTELHRWITSAGWKFVRASGSHYFYEKDGELSPPIPYHGSSEVPKGLCIRIIKQMDLKR